MRRTYTGFGSRTTSTPQTEPIPGSTQVANNAGGFGWSVDDMTRFKRFLLLGSSGGTFYVGERKLTKENLDALERLLKAGRGLEVVDLIVEISDAGRAVSNDPALFALARCCACDAHGKTSYLRPERTYTMHLAHHPELREKFPDEGKTYSFEDGRVTWLRQGDALFKTVKAATSPVQLDHPDDIAVRKAAYAAVPKVARTGTHWLHFWEFEKQFRGRGAAHKRSAKGWYNERGAESLAYQLLKYQSRDGWSQRDALRLARPKPGDPEHDSLYQWVTKGTVTEHIGEPLVDPNDMFHGDAPAIVHPLSLIWAFEQAKRTEDAKVIATLIKQYRLPREAVPTVHLNSRVVWEALLADMPVEAMLRNLGVMTKNEVLTPMGVWTHVVVGRLRNADAIRKARLHPIKILAALTTYQSGKGIRGSNIWTPLREIIDALNDAFYLSFANVVPSGKRLLLAIDTSGSMTMGQVNGIPNLACHMAAGAMALVTAKSEPNYHIIGVDTSVQQLSISPTQRLDDVYRTLMSHRGGGTNLALPMEYALQKKLGVDAFVTYTDSESWQGRNGHPAQQLNEYRRRMGIAARVINVQMTATHVTNNDPDDLLAMEVIGFDTTAPSVVSSFVSGEL